VADDLLTLARSAGRVAIDTEFMAERRYQAMLCPEGVRTDVLDPLSGDEPDGWSPALADPAIEVVVHAGRQDVAILKRSWRTSVTNLFDTQVAAGFLGYGTQESYKSLVSRVLGLPIASSESFTRWDRRPLTEEQLRYAREDAQHLLELAEALQTRLAEAGRLAWAREESRRLESVSDEREPEAVFRRLPKVGRLKPRAQAVAVELVTWREETARRLDRAASSVLPDHVLVELARQSPTRPEQLADVRGLPEATRHRRGRELLAAIARGADLEPPSLPAGAPPPAAADTTAGALLSAVLRQRAADAGIGTQLIATQDDLVRLAAGVRRGEEVSHLRVMGGWRRALVGDELRELLEGRRAVRVGPAGLEVQAAESAPGTGPAPAEPGHGAESQATGREPGAEAQATE
jgi:ribonuclease D